MAAVGQAALWSFGPDFRVSSFLLYPLATLLLALVVTTYLTYGARTTVYRRVVGGMIETDTN